MEAVYITAISFAIQHHLKLQIDIVCNYATHFKTNIDSFILKRFELLTTLLYGYRLDFVFPLRKGLWLNVQVAILINDVINQKPAIFLPSSIIPRLFS
jgi:hypothetical protein